MKHLRTSSRRKAGIQPFPSISMELDSGFRRNDELKKEKETE
jgi:hypothetical protein